MAKVQFTENLKEEYEYLFNTCLIRPERADLVDQTVDSLLANQARYDAVGHSMGVPWFFVAAIHNMESSLSFM